MPIIEVLTEKPKKKSIDCLLRTAIEGNFSTHQANVCIVCDRIIIGVERVVSLAKEQILKHFHRLSVASYNEYYGRTIHPELERQYQIEDMKGLLLSP